MPQGVSHGADFVVVVSILQGKGKSVRAIAEVLAKSRTTIHNFLQPYDSVTGKLLAPGKKRRPRCTSSEQDALVAEYFREKRKDIIIHQAAVDLDILRVPSGIVWTKQKDVTYMLYWMI